MWKERKCLMIMQQVLVALGHPNNGIGDHFTIGILAGNLNITSPALWQIVTSQRYPLAGRLPLHADVGLLYDQAMIALTVIDDDLGLLRYLVNFGKINECLILPFPGDLRSESYTGDLVAFL